MHSLLDAKNYKYLSAKVVNSQFFFYGSKRNKYVLGIVFKTLFLITSQKNYVNTTNLDHLFFKSKCNWENSRNMGYPTYTDDNFDVTPNGLVVAMVGRVDD